jgi:hypothetical protein
VGFVRPGRAELSGNFTFSPRERLFNLKIIECGKYWRWKLFIRFPFLLLPLALPRGAKRHRPSPRVSGKVFVLGALHKGAERGLGPPVEESQASGMTVVANRISGELGCSSRMPGLPEWRWCSSKGTCRTFWTHHSPELLCKRPGLQPGCQGLYTTHSHLCLVFCSLSLMSVCPGLLGAVQTHSSLQLFLMDVSSRQWH